MNWPSQQVAKHFVIDLDRHVQETWSIFQEYADPEFRDRVYTRVTLSDGSERIGIDGRLMHFCAAMWHDPAANKLFDDERFAPNQPDICHFDAKSYLDDMDAEGIGAAVVTPTLGMGSFSIPDGRLGSALCRAYGRWAQEFCANAPDRLLPFYPVNLYDVEQAAVDARWAVEQMSFRGFQIISLPVGQHWLHDSLFEPFWSVVQDLAVPVQVHTLSSLPDRDGKGPLTDQVPGAAAFGANIYFHHLVSHRITQHLALASLVAGGVLARFPRLPFIFVEAGGAWVASWLEEMDSHYDAAMMRRAVPWLKLRPSEYFQRQCLVAFQADETAIGTIAPILGVSNTGWSSDYPHHDGVFPGAVEAVCSQLNALPLDAQCGILGDNAARFCGLS